MTDEQGRFDFDALYEHSLMKWLPFEFVAHQTISLSYQGQTFLLWEGTKRSPDEHSELDGRPLHLRCELSHPQQVQTIGEMTIDGICQLD